MTNNTSETIETGFVGPLPPVEITHGNQYELDPNGYPLSEADMYGGGGPMSADYLVTMRRYARMGIHRPWLHANQAGALGAITVPQGARATYVDPVSERQRAQKTNSIETKGELNGENI